MFTHFILFIYIILYIDICIYIFFSYVYYLFQSLTLKKIEKGGSNSTYIIFNNIYKPIINFNYILFYFF